MLLILGVLKLVWGWLCCHRYQPKLKWFLWLIQWFELITWNQFDLQVLLNRSSDLLVSMYHPYSLNELHSTIGLYYPWWWDKYCFWPIGNVTPCSTHTRCKIVVENFYLVTEFDICSRPFVLMFCSCKGCENLWIWCTLFFRWVQRTSIWNHKEIQSGWFYP